MRETLIVKGGLFLFLLFVYSQICGQNITARTNATDVFARQAFDVEYIIEGSVAFQFEAPDFKPFRKVAGPFTSSSVTIINGRRSESKTYTYRLSIDKTGKYTIPSAKIKTGAYTKKSNSLTINVLKASKANSMQGNNIFLEMNLSDSTLYVGQQLLIDHSIFYGALDVKGSALVGSFERDRFLVNKVIDGTRIRPTQIMYDGKMQNKALISRLSLFPLRSGEMTVPDISFEVDILNPNQPRRRSFFNFNSYDSKIVRTEGFTLNIQALPPNAPDDFTGCVGNLSAVSKISPGPYAVGNEMFLTLEMQGDGIMEQVEAPSWSQENFEIFDPKLMDEQKKIVNGKIQFSKTYRYLIIPQKSGAQRLEVPFSYFDPSIGEYVSKSSKSVALQIGGSGEDLKDATEKDIQLITDEQSSPWYEQLWFWGLLCLLGAGISFYFLRNKKEVKEEITPKEAALIVAKRSLSQAKGLLETGETGKYWEILETSLRIYIEDKLNIGTTDYSIGEITSRWNKSDLPKENLNKWKGMVDKINLARYAGQSIENMESLYQEALDWIVSTEMNEEMV